MRSGTGTAGDQFQRLPARLVRRRADKPGGLGKVPGWLPPLVPGLVLLLADGYGLGRLSFWRDEAYTVDAASRPLAGILALAGHTDAVNSAYYVLMHVWMAVAGSSEATLRWPSVLAMAAAAVLIAAIGRHLAQASRLPAPTLTGVVAGLLFVAAPQVTRYAQDARSYGLVTMLAAAATWLLLRALADGRWRWWAGYGAAVAALGLLNLLALLLLAAHGVTVGITRARQEDMAPPGPHGPAVSASRWAAAAGAVVAMLSPLILTGFQQRRQISWLARPGPHAVAHLVISFAGSASLLPLVIVLVAVGVTVSMTSRPAAEPGMATVAVPWLVVPGAILIAVSQIHPVFDARYIVFCLPALALLTAAGLAGMIHLAMRVPWPAAGSVLAWLPAALILVALVALVAGPQLSVRSAASRPDHLRAASAILATHAHRGDAVLYLPANRRVFSMAYPAPFRRLRDVALAASPVTADNLIGTDVPPAALQARFAAVGRVWVISGRTQRLFLHPAGRVEKAEVALLEPFDLIRRWYAGDVMLSLYRRGWLR
jgi:mannosyltransferase